MNLKPSQLKAFRDGLKACKESAAGLEWLQKVAAVAPEYAPMVDQLADLVNHHSELCNCALAGAGEQP